jgi:hypothetical protein
MKRKEDKKENREVRRTRPITCSALATGRLLIACAFKGCRKDDSHRYCPPPINPSHHHHYRLLLSAPARATTAIPAWPATTATISAATTVFEEMAGRFKYKPGSRVESLK